MAYCKDYLHSPQWQSNHKVWLKKANYRCCILPWLRLGNIKGNYHPYNIHHTNYKNLGSEQFGRDVLPVSRFAHRVVIHGILSGFKRPSEQEVYPNLPQRIIHNWGRFVLSKSTQYFVVGILATFAWLLSWGYSVGIVLFYIGLRLL